MTKKTHTTLPQEHYKAEGILIFVVILWGSSFTYTKIGLDELQPFTLIGIRFLLATLIFPCIYFKHLRNMKLKEAWGGILLGIILFTGYATQTVGLQYTTASRSAFITAMSVCLVPFFVIIIQKKIPQKKAVIGVMIAVIGLILLTNPFKGNLNKGDLFTFICSLVWAAYIVMIETITMKYPYHAVLLWQFITMTLLNFVFMGLSGETFSVPSNKVIVAIIYLTIFCTFLTTTLQTKYQKGTTATRAALIFTSEPVIAAFFAALVLGEHLSSREWIGGIIILAGIVYTEIGNKK